MGCEKTKTAYISVDPCVGFGEGDLSLNTVSVFPNPNNGSFTIDYKSGISSVVSISIVDLAGRHVKTIDVVGSRNGERITCNKNEDLAPGIYFVKVTAGQEESFTKLVVNR